MPLGSARTEDTVRDFYPALAKAFEEGKGIPGRSQTRHLACERSVKSVAIAQLILASEASVAMETERASSHQSTATRPGAYVV